MLVSPCDLYNNVLVSFFCLTLVPKMKSFFFLYWSECHAENVTGLYAQFLNSQNQAEWKSTLRGSSIN